MIEIGLFCYEASEPTLVAFVGIVQILNQKSRYFRKPSNFHHLLHFKLAIIFVPFLPFPARNPPVHDIRTYFHMRNHIILACGSATG